MDVNFNQLERYLRNFSYEYICNLRMDYVSPFLFIYIKISITMRHFNLERDIG